MGSLNLTQRLDEACEQVRRACCSLQNPTAESLSECRGRVEHAMAALEQARAQSKRPVNPELPQTMEKLRREVLRLRRLVAAAGQFHAGWTQLRVALSGTYNSQGGPAPVEGGPRHSFTG